MNTWMRNTFYPLYQQAGKPYGDSDAGLEQWIGETEFTIVPSDERRIADATCPQCRKPFRLCWNDYFDRKITLEVRSCPSGGIYDVRIACPHCSYEEEL